MSVPMPPRNTTAEVVARAASKCLRIACARYFSPSVIGDIAEVLSGGTPSTGRGEYWDGDIVWVTPKDLGRPRNIEIDGAERTITQLGVESSSARVLPEGTVLLSSRAPIGHLGIAARPLTTNQGFKNIICSNRLHNRFLFHMLRGSIDELAAQGRGNTFMEIPGRVVKDFAIPLPPFMLQEAVARLLDSLYARLSGQAMELPNLPPPLAEQRRVVARIEELAGQIQEARGLRQHATEEADALVPRSRNAKLLALGMSFQNRTLGELISMASGDGLTSSEMSESAPYPVYGGGGFNGRYSRYMFEEPMIVIGRVGARCGCVFVTEPKAWVTDNAIYVKRVSPDLDSNYLVHALTTLDLRQKANQAAQPVVSQKQINPLPIPVPPLSIQREVVIALEALEAKVESMKRLQAETAAELDALLPTILDRAFKGELV